jgi:methylenetetrahydrofolate--tRNA-(uracil-5-)-methyltransferase
LAGCEAAWALAERGIDVTIQEMRPVVRTAAHQSDRLAELVCSNSFKSLELANAHGLLKSELTQLGSILLRTAEAQRVPAGAALAVDRDLFSQAVHAQVTAHPRITVERGEVTELPSPGIVATGPLTSDALANAIIQRLTPRTAEGGPLVRPQQDGDPRLALAFYDAIAPIVSHESLNHERLYAMSRYGKGDGDDYLNAPMNRDEYDAFIAALVTADQFTAHEFDKVPYFEGCLPVEEMARRGPETLRFGPMKPVGLPDPRTGRDPYAVVQLRREDRAGQMWNLVGFQTRLRIPEQKRVMSLIPGLENAEVLRYGSIHRNSYINSPAALSTGLTAPDNPTLFFAGYTESLGTGLLAGINLARVLHGKAPVVPPPSTMLGALYRYLREADPKHFQPMNANWGLVEELGQAVGRSGGRKLKKDLKKQLLIERAQHDFIAWLREIDD